ncbi:MAG: AzlD domain-containing protein [Burkholderiales bacterium]|nr:AzlD domain-containing protein [Anaerolineae bacterium]
MNEVILIAGMALVTFAVRYPVLALLSRFQLPQVVTRTLKFVPPAVLAAIVLPEMLFNDAGQISLSYTNAGLIAGVIAALVAWRTKNLLATIVIGMGIYLAWRWLMSTAAL